MKIISHESILSVGSVTCLNKTKSNDVVHIRSRGLPEARLKGLIYIWQLVVLMTCKIILKQWCDRRQMLLIFDGTKK